jgi:hypothetical protein
VLPIKHNTRRGRVIPGLTDERLSSFRFTNLADSSVYVNQNARRMVNGYRLHFSHTATELSRRGHTNTGEELLTNFTESVPFSTIPADLPTLFFTAEAYQAIGTPQKTADLLEDAEPMVLDQLRTASSRRQFSRALQYAGRLRSTYRKANRTEAMDALDQKIDAALSQAPFRVPARIRRAYGLESDTSAGPLQNPGMSPSSQRGTSPSTPRSSSPPNQ